LDNDLSQYSRNTLKKDLQYLVKEGLVLTTGAGRGVKYHAKEDHWQMTKKRSNMKAFYMLKILFSILNSPYIDKII